EFACNIKISFAFDIQVCSRKHQPRAVGRDLLRLRQAQISLLVTAPPSQQPGQIDQSSDLLRGDLQGPSQMRFGAAEFLALFSQSGWCPIPLGRVNSCDLGGRGRSPVEAPSQEARRLQVVLE